MLKGYVITSGRGLFELEFPALVCLLLGYQRSRRIKELKSRTADWHFRVTVNDNSPKSIGIACLARLVSYRIGRSARTRRRYLRRLHYDRRTGRRYLHPNCYFHRLVLRRRSRLISDVHLLNGTLETWGHNFKLVFPGRNRVELKVPR